MKIPVKRRDFNPFYVDAVLRSQDFSSILWLFCTWWLKANIGTNAMSDFPMERCKAQKFLKTFACSFSIWSEVSSFLGLIFWDLPELEVSVSSALLLGLSSFLRANLLSISMPEKRWTFYYLVSLQFGWQVFFMTATFVVDFVIFYFFFFNCPWMYLISMWSVCFYVWLLGLWILYVIYSTLNVLAWHINVHFAFILRYRKWDGEKQRSSPMLRPHKTYFNVFEKCIKTNNNKKIIFMNIMQKRADCSTVPPVSS